MKTSDTMVLALLKKGLAVEGNDIDMDTTIEMDLDFLGEGPKPMKVNIQCKIGSYKVTINEEGSEF